MSRIEFSPFVEAAARLDSTRSPELLFDWYYSGRLMGAALAEAVPFAWSNAHLPFTSLGMATWIELFGAAGYTENGVAAEPPPMPLVVYRASEPRFVHRLAWTGTLDVAGRFLSIQDRRYGKRPRFIYSLTITQPGRVLAHITDRNEDEYVIDTRGLRAKRVSVDQLQAEGFAIGLGGKE